MSCLVCNYISGHDPSCPQYLDDEVDGLEARLMAIIEVLTERVAALEENERNRVYSDAMRKF